MTDKQQQPNDNARTSILFVCLGNICRSPAAEGIMRQLAEQRGWAHRLHIDSAGIGNWHAGQLPDSRMRRHGARHGYNFVSRARQFVADDFDRFDLVIGMDEENVSDLRRRARTQADESKIRCMSDYLRRHPGVGSVPDPYYGGDRDFEWAIELIEDGCEGLIDELEATKGRRA